MYAQSEGLQIVLRGQYNDITSAAVAYVHTPNMTLLKRTRDKVLALSYGYTGVRKACGTPACNADLIHSFLSPLL
jgi:hypothetical protein